MCFLGEGYRLAVPQSRGFVVLLARYSGVLSHSQAFPGAPSQSRAFQSSRGLVVPWSRGLVVSWSRGLVVPWS